MPNVSGRLPRPVPGPRQRGVALITALLVVALATTTAVAMLSRNQLDLRRTANLLHFEQARAYAIGAEQWARAILRRDRKDGETDSLDEDWATVLPPVEVEGGGISGRIEDLQGRLNLNNLIKDGQVSELDLRRLQRLLLILELEPALAQALLDWLDPDIEPRYPDGAEDDYYLGLNPAYRSANAPLTDITELRLVRGFDATAMRKLAPFVTALPGYVPININTASATVLRCLADGVSEAEAEGLLEARGEKGFASVQKFLEDKAFAGREITEDGLSRSSNYFMVHTLIYIGRIRLPVASLIHRASAADIRVLQRSREDG